MPPQYFFICFCPSFSLDAFEARGQAIFILDSYFNFNSHAWSFHSPFPISVDSQWPCKPSPEISRSLRYSQSKDKLCILAKWPIRPALTSCFCSMEGLREFLDGMLVYRKTTLCIKFTSTHLNTFGEGNCDTKVYRPGTQHNVP